MPRRARITLPNIPHHIIQRGNNRQACFFCKQDYQLYLTWLEEYAKEFHCLIHAYVLMTNHVHLLITPLKSKSLGQLMKCLGQRYVQYINRTYRRSGTLWEGRFRSCLAQDEGYVLSCYRYIELNPVRANMVNKPSDYPWSSYHFNGLGKPNAMLTTHYLYDALGRLKKERIVAYVGLFKNELSDHLVNNIRQTTNGNFVLGSDKFKQEIAMTIGRRVEPKLPGRPKIEK
ncbi:MAG: transposase [Thalassotalea sp.]